MREEFKQYCDEKSLNSIVTEMIMIWGGELYSKVTARKFLFINTDGVPCGE